MKALKIWEMAVVWMAFFVVVSCSNSGTAEQVDWINSSVIKGATILTMNGEEVLNGHMVVVKDGVISAILPEEDTPEGTAVIDGTGKWLVPGLAEMHAHIPIPRDGDRGIVDETLFLYLSNGVTTIRGMLGDPFHLQLRSDATAGKILSPRIFTSGPSFNGNSTPDPVTAAAMVREQKAMGYDFLKMHPGLSLETFDEIDRVADSAGIEMAGHVSIDVGIRRTLEAGYASIDHMDGYIEGLVPESIHVDPASNGFFGFNFTDIADMSLMDQLVGMTLSNGVWIVPTQCLLERWSGSSDPEVIIREPEMKYISPRTRNDWVNRVKAFQSADDYDRDKADRFIRLRRDLLKALYDGGAKLVLGSDAPQIFNVPGFSIQHELKAMTDMGLTPFQALQLGTVNAAEYFGMEGQFGIIAPGASADMILVRADPRMDISNMRDPSGVMVRGTWLSDDAIRERLAAIEEKYR